MAVTTALATMVSLVVTLCLLEGLSLMAVAVPMAMAAVPMALVPMALVPMALAMGMVMMVAVPTALAMMVSLVVTLWLLEGLLLMAVAMVASAGGRPREQPPRSEP